MPQLKEIISELEKHFPKACQEDYDNAGLQVFSGDENVTKCLVSLDVTEKVVDEAVEKGCNLIVAHHPLIIFKGLFSLTGATPSERAVMKAVKHSVSIYCAHTNADSMPEGTSKFMAEKIGVKNYKILKPDEKFPFECGAGAIGDLSEPEETMSFLRRIKDTFDCGSIRYTKIIKPEVQKIAFCSGSGSFLLKEAVRQKADVFVSGDFTYHKYFEADDKIIVADLGHFETENGIKKIFCDILQKKFANFAAVISDINTNPINYL